MVLAFQESESSDGVSHWSSSYRKVTPPMESQLIALVLQESDSPMKSELMVLIFQDSDSFERVIVVGPRLTGR